MYSQCNIFCILYMLSISISHEHTFHFWDLVKKKGNKIFVYRSSAQALDRSSFSPLARFFLCDISFSGIHSPYIRTPYVTDQSISCHDFVVDASLCT